MKILFAIILLLPLISFAQVEETPSTNWHFEGTAAALSMRQGKSPMVGPTAIYKATERFALGLRALMSLSGTSTESLVNISLVQRYHFNQTRTSLFLELNEAYNQANRTEYFSSVGTALGLNFNLGNFFSIGGLSGFEMDLEEGKAYPKVMAFLALKM